MTNLAIECSGTAGSVALFDGGTPIAYADLDPSLGSVRTIAGSIKAILRGHGVPKFVSVTNGPGSFTGLRVGLTTAKMLGLAWGIPIVPVDTLQAISLRAFGAVPRDRAGDPFVAVINAFRGQVFASVVEFDESGSMTVLAESCVLDAAAWGVNPLGSLALGNLAPGSLGPRSLAPRSLGLEQLLVSKSGRVWVTGPGLKNFPLSVERPECWVVDESVWSPTAAEVAALGRVGFEAGTATTADQLEPNYIRASAAEEKRRQVSG